MGKLRHINLKLGEAQAFVERFHRHSKPLKRHMFSIGAYDTMLLFGSELVDFPVGLHGVLTVDRCSSAWSKDRGRVEIRRICAAPFAKQNTTSFLIGKAKQACFAMGYRQIVTYTQPHESGTSLKAAGFRLDDYNVTSYTNGRVEGLLRWVCDEVYSLTEYGRQRQNERLLDISEIVKEAEKDRAEQ